jgi:hypothetical protein
MVIDMVMTCGTAKAPEAALGTFKLVAFGFNRQYAYAC